MTLNPVEGSFRDDPGEVGCGTCRAFVHRSPVSAQGLLGSVSMSISPVISDQALMVGGFGRDMGGVGTAAQEKVMLPKKQAKAFGEFYASVRHNDVLEPKTTVMLQLATAMAVGCVP